MKCISIQHNTLSDVRVLSVEFELKSETVEYEIFSNGIGFIRIWDDVSKKYIKRTSDYSSAYYTIRTIIKAIFGDIDFDKLIGDDFDFGITCYDNYSTCYVSDYDSVTTLSLDELKRQVKTSYFKDMRI